jgi:hypothetical protein
MRRERSYFLSAGGAGCTGLPSPSFIAPLKLRIASPKPLPRSPSLLGPKKMRAITRMISSSGTPSFPPNMFYSIRNRRTKERSVLLKRVVFPDDSRPSGGGSQRLIVSRKGCRTTKILIKSLLFIYLLTDSTIGWCAEVTSLDQLVFWSGEGAWESLAETFAFVIPTGAPRECCLFKKSLARSGGIPTEFPPACHFKAFYPDWRWQQPDAKECCFRGMTTSDSPPALPASHERQGNRDKVREELPGAAQPRMIPRDPSTPRNRLLEGTISPAALRSG